METAIRQAEKDSEENERLRKLLDLREQRRDLHFESARIVGERLLQLGERSHCQQGHRPGLWRWATAW